jgi:hypothetical protein
VKPPDPTDGAPSCVALAVARAREAARRGRAPLEAAVRAADSFLAEDHVRAHAVRAGAQGDRRLAAALERIVAAPDPARRQALRREVTGEGVTAALQDLAGQVAAIEAWRAVDRFAWDGARVAASLREAAALNRALWDHPDFPVGVTARRRMLAIVPHLERHAGELEALSGAWRSFRTGERPRHAEERAEAPPRTDRRPPRLSARWRTAYRKWKPPRRLRQAGRGR